MIDTRRQFAAVFIAATTGIAARGDQDRARELIAAVAARYRNASTLRVRAIVRTSSTSGEGTVARLRRSAERVHELLMVQSQARLESGNAMDGKFIQRLVRDRNLFLYANSYSRIYFNGSCGTDEVNGAQKELEKWQFHLATRFARLDELDVERKMRGSGTLRTKRGKVACEVVELRQASRDLAWSERLWIEAETGLVWKMDKTWPPSPESQPGSTTVEVLDYDLAPALSPEAFSTAAPAGYRRLAQAPNLTGPDAK